MTPKLPPRLCWGDVLASLLDSSGDSPRPPWVDAVVDAAKNADIDKRVGTADLDNGVVRLGHEAARPRSIRPVLFAENRSRLFHISCFATAIRSFVFANWMSEMDHICLSKQ